MDAEELIARLAEFRQFFGGDIEGAGSPGFLDRYIYAADPRSVHANVRNEVASGIHHRDIIGCPISSALRSAAAIIFLASLRVIIETSLQ